MEWPKELTVGLELEGFVYKNGEPVDVWEVVKDGVEVAGAGIIKTDAGRHQIEWAIYPSSSWEELSEKYFLVLKETRKRLGEVDIHFVPVDANLINLKLHEIRKFWAPKDRYRILWRALEKEVGRRWWGVLRMAAVSAIHIHVSIPGLLESREGLRVVNYFNSHFWRYANSIRSSYWWGWCDPRRAPAQPGQWSRFQTWEDVVN
ncbi:MAG: hypothetical protein QXL14_00495, partial [Candidatus Aenigmatarchaeota archaeon]